MGQGTKDEMGVEEEGGEKNRIKTKKERKAGHITSKDANERIIRGGGGAIKKNQGGDLKKKKKMERLTALKITSISRKMTPFVGPVSSLLFKA